MDHEDAVGTMCKPDSFFLGQKNEKSSDDVQMDSFPAIVCQMVSEIVSNWLEIVYII